MRFRASQGTFAEISAAAEREGLSRSAFIVKACLSRAQGDSCRKDPALRAIYAELKDLTRSVNRVGVNLNQAVARLNSTGQFSGDLPAYADAALRTVRRLDAITVALWKRLR
jgi:hypothetical protein